MENPGLVIPDVMTAIRALNEAIKQGDGETDERLFTLVACRDTPFFTDAERAACRTQKSGLPEGNIHARPSPRRREWRG
jgi:hypothetical protein